MPKIPPDPPAVGYGPRQQSSHAVHECVAQRVVVDLMADLVTFSEVLDDDGAHTMSAKPRSVFRKKRKPVKSSSTTTMTDVAITSTAMA